MKVACISVDDECDEEMLYALLEADQGQLSEGNLLKVTRMLVYTFYVFMSVFYVTKCADC